MPELYFKGKEFVHNHHLSVPYRPLIVDRDKSLGDGGLDDNLIIHGDNLHALKALLPRYAGKVDCIFIDPPYNTGNEGWCYNDNVNNPVMKEWLSSNPVNKDDMLKHDKWLCMMWPRMVLLRELLSDDGSIWVTLDDHEIHRFRVLMDEVFGEHAFASCIVWQKKYASANDQTGISPMHDYVLVYQNDDWTRKLLDRPKETDSPYRHEDEKGVFRADNYTCNKTAEERKNLYYAITNPNTCEEIWPSKNAVWRYTKDRHTENEENDLVYWGKDGKGKVPAYKRYKHLLKNAGKIVPGTWWDFGFAGHTDTSRKELRDILPEMTGPESTITPKPTSLIERALQIATHQDSVILDSFAGSGSTAHAVLNLNKDDDGNRRFILVECEEYADALTAERVRRVMNGYEFQGTKKKELWRKRITFSSLKKATSLLDEVQATKNIHEDEFDAIRAQIKDDNLIVTGEKRIQERVEGLGGSFTFCTLGDPIDMDDILTGKKLPDYQNLGAWLFHTATGEPLAGSGIDESKWYLGESSQFHVWLVYKPDLSFLKSRDAALTLDLAETISATGKDKKHLVFAPARFVPNKTLLPMGVEHLPLPYALYRVNNA